MKVINGSRIINLDLFDKVECRESLFGNAGGYPVEATRRVGNNTATEEIVRFNTDKYAKDLVGDIARAWANDEKLFDVDMWLKNKKSK